MPTNVNSAFTEFNKNFVSLDPEVTKTARASRDWLLEQLTLLPEKILDFPKLYENMHVHHGSFSRNTKIRPLDDIDLFLAFSGDGTTYTTIVYGESYILNVPESASNLRYLCNEDGTLNSTKLINKIIRSLDKIGQYKQAEKHKNGEAASLQLSSYGWNFDIVPCFYTDTGYYIIPDGEGGWKASDPRVDQQRVSESNQKHTADVMHFIRKVKYWNRRSQVITIKPYLLENIVLNYCDSQDSLSDYIDVNLINFWNYLKTGIYESVDDPKGFQGDLNELTMEDKQKISQKAQDALSKGLEAYEIETEEQNHEKAINKWREIFGDDFPIYG